MREILLEILAVVRPLIELLVMVLGPIFVGWLATKLSATLNVTDAKAKADLEARLRDALHKAAENGLLLAVQRLGIGEKTPVSPSLQKDLVEIAKNYVRQKNPETLAGLGVSAGDLADIITAKLPQLLPKTAN